MLIKLVRKNICIQLRNNSTLSESVSKTQGFHLPVCSETRILKVAILGLPNAGKSTFINNLMDRRVCAASQKVHTTRNKANAIFTEGNTQIVFVDTPGLVNDKEQKKFNLEKTFIRDCKSGSRDADIIGIIHDVTNIWTRERLDIKAINLLKLQQPKPSFLVFNKVDALKSKRKLLDLTRQLTENHIDGKLIVNAKPFTKQSPEDKGWRHFEEVFMVSALTGDGLGEVKDYLIQKATRGEWMFPQNVWTDQSHQTIIENSVKAVLLDYLPEEMPYITTVNMEYFKILDDGSLVTRIVVKCPTKRKAKIAVGYNEGRLKQMTEKVQRDLQEAFRNFVNIQIVIVPIKEK